MIKKCFKALVLATLILVGVACERRPLLEQSEAVRIRIAVDVKTVLNVNTNIRNSVRLYGSNSTLWDEKIEQLTPEVMRVLVYDPDSDRLVAQSFITNNGYDEDGIQVFSGNLGISYGNYNFLVYNFDTPTTQVISENRESSIIAYTDEISPALRAKILGTRSDTKDGEEENVGDLYEDINIHYEPEHLLVANEPNVRISPHDTLVVVQTEASTVIDTYYLQVRVNGLQFASSATAVISGLSPSNKIGINERTVDPSAAVVFEMKKGYDLSIDDENQDVLCAVFNTFGKIEDVESDLFVTFNVYDTAGKLRQYTANLDSVFKSEEARLYHWLIVNEDCLVIDIPDPTPNPQEGGGGFQPQVDDWQEETGEISI